MEKKQLYIGLIIAAMVIGGVLGYAYYYFVGCLNGTCMIKSNPYLMTMYGVIFGGLIMTILLPSGKKKKQVKV